MTISTSVWQETARITLWRGRPVRRRTLHADPYCPHILTLSLVDGPMPLDQVPPAGSCCCLTGADRSWAATA